MMHDGVMCECECTYEDGTVSVQSYKPITPEKEYNDFMAQDSSIKNFMFNQFLSNYCIAGTYLPPFIKSICKENKIKYRALRKEFIKNHIITKFKIF